MATKNRPDRGHRPPAAVVAPPMQESELRQAATRVKMSIGTFASHRKSQLAHRMICGLIEEAISLSLLCKPSKTRRSDHRRKFVAIHRAASALRTLLNLPVTKRLLESLSWQVEASEQVLQGRPVRFRIAAHYPRAEQILEETRRYCSILADATALLMASRLDARRSSRQWRYKAWIVVHAAKVFENLTGMKATRRIRGEDHPEYGQPYGPFWNFMSALWIELFGSTIGLDKTMRQWTELPTIKRLE